MTEDVKVNEKAVEEAKAVELKDGAVAPVDISNIAGSDFALSTPVAEQNGKTAGPVGVGPAGLKAENADEESLVVKLPGDFASKPGYGVSSGEIGEEAKAEEKPKPSTK